MPSRTCSCRRNSPARARIRRLRRDRGPLYAFTTQGLYAVGVAGVALGIARAMHEAFMALAVDKTPRNMARLADNPVVQSTVARHEADARLGARLSGRHPEGMLGRRRRHRAARLGRTRARAAGLQPGDPSSLEKSPTRSTRRPARRRSSSARRSSGASATSTRCRSRSSRARRISRRSAEGHAERRSRRHFPGDGVTQRAVSSRFDPLGGQHRGPALVGRDLGDLAARQPPADRHRHLDIARLAVLDLDLAVGGVVADPAIDLDRPGGPSSRI